MELSIHADGKSTSKWVFQSEPERERQEFAGKACETYGASLVLQNTCHVAVYSTDLELMTGIKPFLCRLT